MVAEQGAILDATHLSKAFGGRTVLSDVDLSVLPGEIHALLGENGSGKSTLIKILAGYHRPEPGARLTIRGTEARFPFRPGDARRLGLAVVHQDLGLIENSTVVESFRMRRYSTRFPYRINWRHERKAVASCLERFAIRVSPRAIIGELAETDRALVAIARAVDELGAGDVEQMRSVLVLDEATAYLPRDGIEDVFAALSEIARAGNGILFVTHRLAEVRAIGDRVTVLRDGRRVWTSSVSGLSDSDLTEKILGFGLGDLYPERRRTLGGIVATVSSAAGAIVREFGMTIRSGEIVGVTGLLGMGWEELPYLLFGALKEGRGELTMLGRTCELGEMTARRAVRCGIGLIPGNRHRDGLAAEATATENLTLLTMSQEYVRGRLRRRRERDRAISVMDVFQVRPKGPGLPMRTFSGGNQQKVLLAKWLAMQPRLLLMHEPTHGVDVGAKRQILEIIESAARDGAAIVLASAEYEDLARLCDRVIVLRDGRAAAELSGASLTQSHIAKESLRPDEAEATERSVRG